MHSSRRLEDPDQIQGGKCLASGVEDGGKEREVRLGVEVWGWGQRGKKRM